MQHLNVEMPSLDVDEEGNWRLEIVDKSGAVGVKVTAYDLTISKFGQFDDVLSWGELVDLLSDINAASEYGPFPVIAIEAERAEARAARLLLVQQMATSPGVKVAV